MIAKINLAEKSNLFKRIMKNKQRQDKKWSLGKLLHSRLFLFFCLTVIVLLSVSVVKELLRRQEINRQINQLEAEIASIENNNQELSGLVDYFNSSTFQEKEVKTRLNLKASGEKVVFLSNTNKNSVSSNQEAITEGEKKNSEAKVGNPQKWIDYFFNKQ